MKVGIIRHGNVLYRDPFFSTGKTFDAGRVAYDAAAIAKTTLKIMAEDFPVCYVSSKQRAIDTANLIYPGTFMITDEIIEVRNSALFLLKIHLPSALRSVIGRIAWFFNYHKMPETRMQSNQRAQKFLAHLVETTEQNVLLVTHGFFMQSLRHELRKLGFKGHCPYLPPNATLYVFEKK
ncbi:MAG TPA: histidine phosphatase family protein [Chitinophagales bacterium]|nr:histidine phosphatase family protein [Chitinophagales bacterium]